MRFAPALLPPLSYPRKLSTSVRNMLSLHTSRPQPIAEMTSPPTHEEAIATAIDTAMQNSGHAEIRRIHAKVGRDYVVLQGVVSSFYLKQTAQELIRQVAPKHQVCNKLKVSRPSTAT